MKILTEEISESILNVLTKYEKGIPIDDTIKKDISNIKSYINRHIEDLSDEVNIDDEFED